MRFYITSGDPAGIGPEICLRLLADLIFEKDYQKDEIFFLADSAVLHDALHRLADNQLTCDLSKKLANVFDDFVGGHIDGVKLISPDRQFPLEKLSKPGACSGSHAYDLLSLACLEIKKDLAQGKKVALVTGPIDKSNIAQKADAHFLGHTEYLANQFDCDGKVTMCFSTPLFQMVLATTHIALADVQKKLTKECLEKAIRHALLLQKLMQDDLPLMVFGLNPHAGEKGLIGTGDEIIAEVIESFCKDGAKIEGPLPADGAIRHAAHYAFEGKKRVLLACYHDQGLVAAKLAARNYDGVNFTLGLPFFRTSVDHGTAYDARGKADYRSIKAALSFAKEMTNNQVGAVLEKS